VDQPPGPSVTNLQARASLVDHDALRSWLESPESLLSEKSFQIPTVDKVDTGSH